MINQLVNQKNQLANQSANQSTYLSIYFSIYLLFIHLSSYLSLYLSTIHLSIYYLSIYPFIYLSIRQSTSPSISQSLYQLINRPPDQAISNRNLTNKVSLTLLPQVAPKTPLPPITPLAAFLSSQPTLLLFACATITLEALYVSTRLSSISSQTPAPATYLLQCTLLLLESLNAIWFLLSL